MSSNITKPNESEIETNNNNSATNNNNDNNITDGGDVSNPERATRPNVAHMTGRHPSGALIDGKNTLGSSDRATAVATARMTGRLSSGALIDCKNTAGPDDDCGSTRAHKNDNNIDRNNILRANPPSQHQRPSKDRFTSSSSMSKEEVGYEQNDEVARNRILNRPHKPAALQRQHQQQEDVLLVDAQHTVETVIDTVVKEGDAYLLPDVTDTNASSDGRTSRHGRKWRLLLIGVACIALALLAVVVVVGVASGTTGCLSAKERWSRIHLVARFSHGSFECCRSHADSFTHSS